MCWQGFRKRPRSTIRRPLVGRHQRYRRFGSEAKPTRRTFVTASSRRRPRACRRAGSRCLQGSSCVAVRQELSRGTAALSWELCAVAWRTQCGAACCWSSSSDVGSGAAVGTRRPVDLGQSPEGSGTSGGGTEYMGPKSRHRTGGTVPFSSGLSPPKRRSRPTSSPSLAPRPRARRLRLPGGTAAMLA